MEIARLRLLLATEHTEFDLGAETVAFALARARGEPLPVILPVLSNAEFEAVAPEMAARADAEAARRRAALAEAAGELVLEVKVRRGAEPDQEIVDEARARDTQLLITRRRGKRGFLAQLLVGEMVSKVLSKAPCDMLIVPREAQFWRRGVLAAVDPRAPDLALVEAAAHIARHWRLGLSLVAVAEEESDITTAQQVIDQARVRAAALYPAVRGEVRRGRVADALREGLHTAGADLLLLGRRSTAGGPALGGTTQKIIGRVECPVWIKRPLA